MEIWLKHSASDQILLPVTPEEFHITEKSENTTVVVNSLGEINLLGKRGLKEGSISSFFPNQDYPFANGDDDPYDYVEKILKWKESGTTVRLLIGGDTNILVAIETFEYGEQDGSGDVYYTLTFKEYREIELKKKPKKKKKKNKKSKKKKRKSKSKKSSKSYKTKKGDTLRKIAKKHYGDSSKYKKIYNANKGKLKNAQTVPAGVTLKIP